MEGLKASPFSAILIGGTGATGKLVVAELLKLENLQRLVLLLRKAAKYDDPRVVPLEVNFDKLGFEFEAKKDVIGKCDVMLSFLGTTKSQAGGADNYRKIEVDYPKDFGRMARSQCGVKHAILMSSDGAKAGSMVTYLSQKGQVEDEWKKLDCDTLTILRPGVLDRGEQSSTMEKIFGKLMTPMPCGTIAKAVKNRVRDIFILHPKDPKEVVWRNHEITQYSEKLPPVDLLDKQQKGEILNPNQM